MWLSPLHPPPPHHYYSIETGDLSLSCLFQPSLPELVRWKSRSTNANVLLVAAASTIGLICHLPTLMPFCFIVFSPPGAVVAASVPLLFHWCRSCRNSGGLSAFPWHTQRTHLPCQRGGMASASCSEEKNQEFALRLGTAETFSFSPFLPVPPTPPILNSVHHNSASVYNFKSSWGKPASISGFISSKRHIFVCNFCCICYKEQKTCLLDEANSPSSFSILFSQWHSLQATSF